MTRTAVVTICGSMRFYDQMLTVAADETRAGRIVLLPHAVVQPDDQGTDLKAMLDRLHREKIDLSDRVVVVSDHSGYYGTSTSAEIDYARSHDKPVTFFRVRTGHSSHQDAVEDLTARLAAADLAWAYQYGDPAAEPCYLRHLAWQVCAFSPPLTVPHVALESTPDRGGVQ